MTARCAVCQAPITSGAMCARHWRLVPGQIKTRVWATRDETQRRGKSPKVQAATHRAYMQAVTDAADHVRTYFPESLAEPAADDAAPDHQPAPQEPHA